MNRKNKLFKKYFFWSQKFYLPLVLIFIFPILICCLIGKSLTLVEVEKISNTNFFTRAIFEIIPDNSNATYIVLYVLISTSLLMIFRKKTRNEHLMMVILYIFTTVIKDCGLQQIY
ncbi:Uncharacterised protein [Streptococcus pneumoniae]|nr:Uncharacterised protein [Streptococcus pneumoniae]